MIFTIHHIYQFFVSFSLWKRGYRFSPRPYCVRHKNWLHFPRSSTRLSTCTSRSGCSCKCGRLRVHTYMYQLSVFGSPCYKSSSRTPFILLLSTNFSISSRSACDFLLGIWQLWFISQHDRYLLEYFIKSRMQYWWNFIFEGSVHRCLQVWLRQLVLIFSLDHLGDWKI